MEAVLIPFSAEQSSTLKSQNFPPTTVHGGGLLNFPPPPAAFYCRRQQPPLLPLPPPPCRQMGATKSRGQSLTPKKSKSKQKSIIRSREPPAAKSAAEFVIVDSTNRLGPEPSLVPKGLWKVLGLGSSGDRSLGGTAAASAEMEFSGSAFSVSPPPSSLPLPKFWLRREVSCNVEAAGVDAGATDNLRRLLRLR